MTTQHERNVAKRMAELGVEWPPKPEPVEVEEAPKAEKPKPEKKEAK